MCGTMPNHWNEAAPDGLEATASIMPLCRAVVTSDTGSATGLNPARCQARSTAGLADPTPQPVAAQVVGGMHRLAREELHPADRRPHQRYEAARFELLVEERRHLLQDVAHLVVGAHQHRLGDRQHAGIDVVEADRGHGGGLELADAHLANHVQLVAGDAAGEDLHLDLAVGDARPVGREAAQRQVPRGVGRRHAAELDGERGGAGGAAQRQDRCRQDAPPPPAGAATCTNLVIIQQTSPPCDRAARRHTVDRAYSEADTALRPTPLPAPRRAGCGTAPDPAG